MAVITEPRERTQRELERDLAEARKALQRARMATLDPNPDVEALAAERDHHEAELNTLRGRRYQLRETIMQLRGHLGPIVQDNPVELVETIGRMQREHDDMERDVIDAEAQALRAVRAYNRANQEHANRTRRVTQLEQLVMSLERDLEKLERAGHVIPRRRSWRDLIQTK